MNYKGVIIEKSLEKKDVLGRIKILSTKIEQVVDKHKTPWLKQWTLYTVEIRGKMGSAMLRRNHRQEMV